MTYTQLCPTKFVRRLRFHVRTNRPDEVIWKNKLENVKVAE